MELEYIENITPETWDKAISNFNTKFLFHQSAWLKFLQETQGGKVLRFRIVDKGEVIGYFVGLLLKKAGINILGSPLPGWTTNYMGPIVDEEFNLPDFLDALHLKCQDLSIHHLELSNPFLSFNDMNKMNFDALEGYTYMVPLSSDDDQMWANLKSNCRNRIRKGRKNNLVVEDCSDPSFVDMYYDQLIEVFAKQNLTPTYSIDRVKSLYRNLMPDNLLALQVKHEDTIIATGLFPHDDRCVYFFGGASWLKYQYLNPNELLHWTAMTLSAKLGIKQYNMCGGGSFKPKFGGEKIFTYRYYKSSSVMLKFVREAYKSFHSIKQKLKGKVLSIKVIS
jgi:hypothetical protein